MQHARDLPYLGPTDAWHRVEVNAQLVGMVEILRTHRVRVQLETCEVGHPGESGGISWHHLFGGTSGREAEGHDLDPGWPRLWRTLLIKELTFDAVWVAHEHVGPPARRAEGTVRHCEIVADEIHLGVARLREQHFPGVRDCYFAETNDYEFLLGVAAHEMDHQSVHAADPPRARCE